MILFNKDWDNYPTAIVHHTTKNESWVRHCAWLKAKGIKNCWFPLALINPELEHVDVHSPNLTQDQKLAIKVELRNNPWYWLREVARVPAGGSPSSIKANPGLIAYVWTVLLGVIVGFLMPRQEGKSVGADLLLTWLAFFVYRDQELFIYTKDAGLKKRTIQRMRKELSYLPEWLIPITNKDSTNSESITCVTRSTVIRTVVGQAMKDRADNVCRGETFAAFNVDEGPFIVNSHISLGVALSAMARQIDDNVAAGLPTMRSITTTAGRRDTEEGKFFYNFIHSGCRFTETKLLDCVDAEDAKDIIATNSSNSDRLVVNCTYTHRMLGYKDEYIRRRIADSGQTVDAAERDYLLIWNGGSEQNPLKPNIQKAIELSKDEPLYEERDGSYYIDWYIAEDVLQSTLHKGQWILGLDTGEAIGRDANALVIMNSETMEIVGLSTVKEANLYKYALWIFKLLSKYPTMFLVPENKSSFTTMLDTIATYMIDAGINPFNRIFNRVHDELVNSEDGDDVRRMISGTVTEQTFIRYKKYFGFKTNGSNRPFLYDTVLTASASATGHKVKHPTLVSELLGLIIKNGRVDHGSDSNDDHVIAWLVANWFVRFGKNIGNYQLEPNKVMNRVAKEGATLTDEEIDEKVNLALIREKVNRIKDSLKSAPPVVERVRLETVMQKLLTDLNNAGDDAITFNDVMNEIRDKGVKRKDVNRAARIFRGG